MDEPMHAAAAYLRVFLGDYRLNLEDPPLWNRFAMLFVARGALVPPVDSEPWKQAVETGLPHFRLATTMLYETPGVDGHAFMRRARAGMAALGALVAGALAWWTWRLAGAAAAVMATALFALDPNFLAHAPLVKNDVAFAGAMLGASFAAWRLGRAVTPANLLLGGAACGLGCLMKFSGVLLLQILGVCLAARALLPEPWPVFGRPLAGRVARLAAALAAALLCAVACWGIIWAGYGFRFAITPEGQTRDRITIEVDAAKNVFRLENGLRYPDEAELQAALDDPHRVIAAVRWLDDRRALPQAYLLGFLYTWQSTLLRPAFLLGMRSELGWPHYFPLVMLFKTPLATIAAVCGAALLAWHWRRLPGIDRWTGLCLLLPPALYLANAVNSHLNLGVRHVLAVYPFLFILAGVVGAELWRRAGRGRWAVLGLGGLLTIESLAAWPNYIPFFNAAAGGARGGLRLAGDSNLDWGQDLPALARWQQQNPGHTLYLSYFGGVDPQWWGIEHTALPGNYVWGREPRAIGGPGVVAISATRLQGIYGPPELRDMYKHLTRLQPRDVLGGSIYLYDWPPR